MNPAIADIRKDYRLQSLDENDVAANAIEQFTRWWQEAIDSQIDEVNAMTLATVNKQGMPTARIVLLKGYDENGFVFFTNYHSQKGIELAQNPYAALVFFWKELERQVRIEGVVERTSEDESDAYYNSRPEGSRIGAWASPQSSIIQNRRIIEQNMQQYEKRFAGSSIPRPDHWGGYIVKPVKIEFWQGRSNRLHDRIVFSLGDNGSWKRERLAP